MRVYISGAISNNPDYKWDFVKAKALIVAEGHEAVNPAEVTIKGGTWLDFILKVLLIVLSIYLYRIQKQKNF